MLKCGKFSYDKAVDASLRLHRWRQVNLGDSHGDFYNSLEEICKHFYKQRFYYKKEK